MTILSHRDYRNGQRYDVEVVVVGTGAGGAVVGAELAEAGREVLFIEEGGYHPTSSFNPYLTESLPRLYRDAGGTIIMGRPPIPYAEGRCVGGSTVINGGMTWRAPEQALVEWERITGQPDLGAKAMEPLFDRRNTLPRSAMTVACSKKAHADSVGGMSTIVGRRIGAWARTNASRVVRPERNNRPSSVTCHGHCRTAHDVSRKFACIGFGSKAAGAWA
jgi:choline dehydrogenase-like flavoprotein